MEAESKVVQIGVLKNVAGKSVVLLVAVLGDVLRVIATYKGVVTLVGSICYLHDVVLNDTSMLSKVLELVHVVYGREVSYEECMSSRSSDCTQQLGVLLDFAFVCFQRHTVHKKLLWINLNY